MEKSMTVRDLVNAEQYNFDPMSIDTKEIQRLSNSFPKDGNVDLNNAEVMATKYLRGADLCGEMLAIATAYVAKTKSLKDQAYHRAFLSHKDNPKIKTDKMRAAMAEINDDYVEACNKYNEAAAFLKWVNTKFDNFVRMHYHCRSIVKRQLEQQQASGWNGNASNIPEPEDDGW